ncbi:14107_t:CDS:2, partial [Acaulospora colombiana]
MAVQLVTPLWAASSHISRLMEASKTARYESHVSKVGGHLLLIWDSVVTTSRRQRHVCDNRLGSASFSPEIQLGQAGVPRATFHLTTFVEEAPHELHESGESSHIQQLKKINHKPRE